MALLGTITKHKIVPGVTKKNYYDALKEILTDDILTRNRELCDIYAS